MAEFSLVIINNDGAEYLPKLFESIYEQTELPDIEYVFIDNCSSDSSVDRARKFGIEKIYRLDNKTEKRGILYNQAKDLVTSQYIIFIHSDTYFSSDFFAKLKTYLNTECVDGLAVFGQYYVDYYYFGLEQVGIDINKREIFYRQLFKKVPDWIEWLTECSEGCFLVNKNVLDMVKFDETFKNSFYEHYFFQQVIEQGKTIRNFNEIGIFHYFLENHEKIKTLAYDEALFKKYFTDHLIRIISQLTRELHFKKLELADQEKQLEVQLAEHNELIQRHMSFYNKIKRLINRVNLHNFFAKK